MNPLPEVEKDKRIEQLEQALASEQRGRFRAEQDAQHWRELGLDCWLQFSYLRVGYGRNSGGHSTLEALRHSLEEMGLIDEKGEVVEQ